MLELKRIPVIRGVNWSTAAEDEKLSHLRELVNYVLLCLDHDELNTARMQCLELAGLLTEFRAVCPPSAIPRIIAHSQSGYTLSISRGKKVKIVEC